MQNSSAMTAKQHPKLATTSLPSFVLQRIEGFEQRVKLDWDGRHIMRGRSLKSNDLILQSNDYLHIAQHPEIVEAQCSTLHATNNYLLMSACFLQDEANSQHVFENDLAKNIGAEAGILAQSGWCANVGLIQSIATERTPVYIDMFAHMSLWEGIKSANAKPVTLYHNDPEHLERMVLRHGPGIVIVDAVYSTNGSLSPLLEIIQIAERYGCVLVVDESHSLGTHGPRGEGLVASLGLAHRVHFRTASLAKAYPSRAGFIACPARFKGYFGAEALPAIFSSTLLPHEIAGLSAMHRIIERDDWRRQRLHAITRQVRGEIAELGYNISDGTEQIIALEPGPEALTMRTRDALEAHGIVGSVFCAPATPKNRSLVRLSLNAGMTDADIQRLIHACAAIRDEVDLSSWSSTRRLHRNRNAASLAAAA